MDISILEGLAEKCGRLLLEKNKTLATAESCTGGLIAASIVGINGCSDWFSEGCVTYSNNAKINRLGVNSETLEKHTAVSSQTAIEMAKGIKESSGAHFGISTTGIAGPLGGTKASPVGTVFVCIFYDDKSDVTRLSLSGSRNEIRFSAAEFALSRLYSILSELQ